MNPTAQSLAAYFVTTRPEGLQFDDAAQLCMRLYCTVAGLPSTISGPVTAECLAETFSSLAARGWVRAAPSGLAITDLAAWLEITASVTRQHPYTYDLHEGERIAKAVGL